MNHLDYLSLGWFLIPIYEIKDGQCSCGKECSSAGKHPRGGRGLKHASNDPKVVERWLKQWPSCSWAVACAQSGFLAIDVDPRAGGNTTFRDLSKMLGALPETVQQVTGGDGMHYLFRSPDEEIKGKLGEGVDLKNNGYILIEPSNHISGGKYRWLNSPMDYHLVVLPKPWLELARKKIYNDPKPPRERKQTHYSGETTPYGRRALEDECTELATMAPETGRNNKLNEVALKIGALVGGGEIVESDARAALAEAAQACECPGWQKTLESGLVVGLRNPRSAPEKTTKTSSATAPPLDEPPPHTDDEAPEGTEAAAETDWRKNLRWNETQHGNKLTTDPGNAVLVLCNDPAWEGRLAHDELRHRIIWLQPPPIVEGLASPTGDWKDEHLAIPQHWLRLHYGTNFSKDSVQLAVTNAAKKEQRHPVREYLKGLKWDGQCRVFSWLSAYLGAKDTEENQEMGRMWLVAAVARVMRPGCRVNHMLILEGPQQIGKSTAVQTLAGDWYQEKIGDLRGKSAEENIQGFWIIEISEMDAFRGAAATRIKSFISTMTDSFRPAYGRTVVDYPRQCVCVGTTNETAYLHDSSGGMRFWPVRVHTLDLAALKQDRDQLWAEAVEQYKSGVQWWPSATLAQQLIPIQEERYQGDPWEEKIMLWLKGKVLEIDQEVSIDDALSHLSIEMDRRDRQAQIRIGTILQRAGWKSKRVRREGLRVRRYYNVERARSAKSHLKSV